MVIKYKFRHKENNSEYMMSI